MPNGYNKKSKGKVTWHEGPPRSGTVGMRATRFRLQTGLLSWEGQRGNVSRNEKILSLIPESCKAPAVNSTASHRDFNADEQEAVSKVLRGTVPNRARKVNRIIKGKQMQVINNNPGDDEDNIDIAEDYEVEDRGSPSGPQDRIVESSGDVIDSDDQDMLDDQGGEAMATIQTSKATPQISFGRESSKAGGISTLKIGHERGLDELSSSSEGEADRPLAKRQRGARPVNSGASNKNIHYSNPGVNGISQRLPYTGLSASKPPERASKAPSVLHNPGDITYGSRDGLTTPFEDESWHSEDNTMIDLTAVSDSRESQSSDSIDPATAFLNKSAAPAQVPTYIKHSDYRVIDPANKEDMIAIQEALELTHEDYRQKTGLTVSPFLAIGHIGESYNVQYNRLQELYVKSKKKAGARPQLYRLPAWDGGFANWGNLDQEGAYLYSKVLK